ncbi:MAG: hypothetical protein OEW00_11470 [candidate division Zixibacteria bacterium]|nr:hypothetical protein [candidate division Zixibacteria bacterium]
MICRWIQKEFLTGCVFAGVLCFCSVAAADPLVTRNDFICYDTLGTVSPDLSGWQDVSIDSSGRISETNSTRVYTDPFSSIGFYQFNRFDKYGDQSQPVIFFLPDTVHADTVYALVSRLFSNTNHEGTTFVGGMVKIGPAHAYGIRTVGWRFGPDGAKMGDPICFDCDITYCCDLSVSSGAGDINNQGVLGMIWNADMLSSPYDDTVYARLYYPDGDSLSPLIAPMSLPSPLPQDILLQYPRIGVADDGSFVAVWHEQRYCRTYYVVYNADCTPRSDMMIAECIDNDTASCALNSRYIDLAIESDGDFYITWYGPDFGTGTCFTYAQIFMRGFNSDGTAKYDPVHINDTDSLYVCQGEEIYPSIACDDNGNVLVAWSDARDYPGYNIYGYTPRNVYVQKIDPEGNLVGPNYRINNNLGKGGWLGENVGCDLNNAGQAIILWRNWQSYYRVSAQLMPYDDIATFVPGDLNLDFKGNISDLTYILTYLFGSSEDSVNFWPRSMADFNCDGKNGNISDVCYMVSYLFGMPTGPEPCTPDEGIRPTPPYNDSGRHPPPKE